MINFFYTDEYLNHDTGQHPESIERIKTVKKLIFEKYSNHNILTPTLASKELIYNVHDKNYVDYILQQFGLEANDTNRNQPMINVLSSLPTITVVGKK